MSQLAYTGPGKTLAIHTNASTLPEPTVYGDGVLLDSLKTGRENSEITGNFRSLPESAILRIDAVSADVTLIGPVELFAGVDADSRYRMAGQFADGLTFTVKAQRGFEARILLGGDWDRVRLVCPGLSGPVNVTLVTEVSP